MAAGDGNGHIARQNPGADLLPLVDLIPQLGVKVQDAAHGADGGDAGEQLLPGVACHHGLAQLFGEVIGGYQLHGLYGVTLLLLGLAGACQVDMEVDQPGQYILPVQVPLGVVLGYGSCGDNSLNFALINQNSKVLPGLHGFGAIQQDTVGESVFVH